MKPGGVAGASVKAPRAAGRGAARRRAGARPGAAGDKALAQVSARLEKLRTEAERLLAGANRLLGRLS